MSPTRFAMLLALSLLTGCMSAFNVSEKPSSKGLPFYLKSVVYRQHTLLEYPWLRVSMSSAPILETKDGVEKLGARTTMVKDIADNSTNRAAVLSLQALIANLPQTAAADVPGAVKTIQSAFKNLASLPADHLRGPDASSMRPAANYVERVSVVDYSKPYYLNAKVPVFGSSNLAAELSADGTLSKGSNSVTGGGSEALGAVVGALTGLAPIKEVLTAKWIPTKADDKKIDKGEVNFLAEMRGLVGPSKAFRYELTVEPQSVTYDFTADQKTELNGTELAALKPNWENRLFTIRPADKPAEKAPDNALSFSGKVQLPEAKKP